MPTTFPLKLPGESVAPSIGLVRGRTFTDDHGQVVQFGLAGQPMPQEAVHHSPFESVHPSAPACEVTIRGPGLGSQHRGRHSGVKLTE
jgi:hypothetical protein